MIIISSLYLFFNKRFTDKKNLQDYHSNTAKDNFYHHEIPETLNPSLNLNYLSWENYQISLDTTGGPPGDDIDKKKFHIALK